MPLLDRVDFSVERPLGMPREHDIRLQLAQLVVGAERVFGKRGVLGVAHHERTALDCTSYHSPGL